jgi:hypothetical protein
LINCIQVSTISVLKPFYAAFCRINSYHGTILVVGCLVYIPWLIGGIVRVGQGLDKDGAGALAQHVQSGDELLRCGVAVGGPSSTQISASALASVRPSQGLAKFTGPLRTRVRTLSLLSFERRDREGQWLDQDVAAPSFQRHRVALSLPGHPMTTLRATAQIFGFVPSPIRSSTRTCTTIRWCRQASDSGVLFRSAPLLQVDAVDGLGWFAENDDDPAG